LILLSKITKKRMEQARILVLSLLVICDKLLIDVDRLETMLLRFLF